ncbi:MAG: polysaccharide biosynthesis/export family protein [Pseudomonadales bacterium]|nr:polysaccharide biosynthesis/export family protein [Pseudomonadales bacterium]
MRLMILSVLLLVVAACSTTREYAELTVNNNYFEGEYIIGVGDTLNVSVWRNEDLSITVPVRPDGKISTPLVGDVVAAGLTASELSAMLTDKLENFVRTPQVTVIVTSPRSAEYLHRIRVVGAVESPQSVPYRVGMTVMDAVLLAGGTLPFAAGNNAKLSRGDNTYPVYLDDILKQGDMKSNYELMPSDTISIPEKIF